MSRKKSLTLGEKLKVIEEYNEGKCSVRQMVKKYEVGRSQMYTILKNQNKILEEFAKGRSTRLKRLRRTTANEKVNRAIYDWYVNERERGTFITGVMLQNEALLLAKTLGMNDFKASNGWLDSFKRRHDIQLKTQPSSDSSEGETLITEKKWRDNLKDLIIGYHSSNIYTGDVTGLLYRLLPSEVTSYNREDLPKEQLTVLLCANMDGGIEKPLVIGNKPYPSCFKNLNHDTLPVHWKYNKKSRVNNEILTEWLMDFNNKMQIENRNVILFLSSAICATKITLSNVQLELFPSDDTVFTAQAIYNVANVMKSYYRKHFLQSLIAKSNIYPDLSDSRREINVLDAVNWINQAVKKIHPELVKNCFISVGLCGNEPFKIYDRSVENLNEIFELCTVGGLRDSGEDIMAFDGNLELIEDALETGVKEEDRIKDELDEQDGYVENPKEIQIGSYEDALTVVDGLQEFAAIENHAKLMELLGEVKELILPSILKRRVN
ncbi:hypothetical protein Trydic_g5176 [Trypoxylus dichotomus]